MYVKREKCVYSLEWYKNMLPSRRKLDKNAKGYIMQWLDRHRQPPSMHEEARASHCHARLPPCRAICGRAMHRRERGGRGAACECGGVETHELGGEGAAAGEASVAQA